MASFDMCPDCLAEYSNPLDRRFHAQPVACPTCGPQVWLETKSDGELFRDEALSEARRLLLAGKIVAIKGLGGFHLACDATNSAAVAELRQRKLRADKPFALMMPSLESVEAHCLLNQTEREQLNSRERPIVILSRREGSTIVHEVAPGQDWLGIMLPYTPLHHLLLSLTGFPLVATSGNLSDEPICIDEKEALERLGGTVSADTRMVQNGPACDGWIPPGRGGRGRGASPDEEPVIGVPARGAPPTAPPTAPARSAGSCWK